MKKNKMMRLASFLLIAVLVSTSAISGTYAKYVTSDYAEDNARVAKFGVKVEGNTDMFAKYYVDTAVADAASATVASSNEDKLVAPGTEGTLAAFNITGQPEVDVRVSYKVEADSFKMLNWKIDGTEEYCPIVFTISKNGAATDYYIDGSTITTVDQLIAAVTNAIDTHTVDYEANDVLDTAADDDLVISWKWHFEGKGDDAGNSGPACQFDVKDTKLGDQAAADVTKAATIAIKVTCTVTQID